MQSGIEHAEIEANYHCYSLTSSAWCPSILRLGTRTSGMESSANNSCLLDLRKKSNSAVKYLVIYKHKSYQSSSQVIKQTKPSKLNNSTFNKLLLKITISTRSRIKNQSILYRESIVTKRVKSSIMTKEITN